MRSESEPKAKKQRMEESNQQTGTAAAVGTHFHGIKRMALTFAEFLSDPFTFSPRPEFIENFFIDDDTALVSAIRVQNAQAVAALLQAGCNPNLHNKKGVMPISAAAHKGDINIMELLISKGAVVDALNVSGSTALIQAAHFGHTNAVLLLLQHGGDSDKANAKGTTALMRAAQEGHEEITRILIQAKANVNRKNHEGMNALMLASQRGHAGVVLELIKSGAVTDEQTSQGSTALMLSCKRGHEKVVNALVSMGAEICMKDCRNRTAKDTAERRHHINLLRYLDTQYQIKCIQENSREERAALLDTLRSAALRGTLQFSRDTTILNSIVFMFKKIQRASNKTEFRAEDVLTVASEWTSSNSFPNLSTELGSEKGDGPVEKIVNGGGILNLCRNIATAISHSTSPPQLPNGMTPRVSGNASWDWPFLLMRCMSLPLGVYEMIVDYLPSPRVWKWSLNQLKRRTVLSPHVAVVDTSILIDELLGDLLILESSNQKGALVRISQNSQIRNSLVNDLHFPEVLVENLVRWSDVQSLVFRTTELDVSFKSPLAKRYLLLAITLYRMVRHVYDPTRLFTLPKMLMQPPPSFFTRRDQRPEFEQNESHARFPSPSFMAPQVTPLTTGMLDHLLLHGALDQMLSSGGNINQSVVDNLDDEDSLTEFGGLTNDHDTETELPGDGGNFAGSDDEEDDN